MSDPAIHQLRRKVTLASMAAVLASVAALVIAINYANYRQTLTRLHAVMEEMASPGFGGHAEGKREGLEPTAEEELAWEEDEDSDDAPGQGWGQADDSSTMGGRTGDETPRRDGSAEPEELSGLPETEADEDYDDGPQSEEGFGPLHRGGRQSARTQYSSRFFIATIDGQGNTTIWAKGNSDLSDQDATSLAQQVIATNTAEGMLDDYLYAVENDEEYTRILFLDCTTDVQSLQQLLSVSVVVGSVAFLIASLFVFRFSSLAVHPLEESAQKQKRFVADAGHELKTPLSVIATNMDILVADLADQPDKLEWVESTNRQVTNMRGLVNDLISLSKMEEGEADLVFSEVSLSDLAHECVLTFGPVAHTQGKELVSTIGEGLNTTGDEPSLRQLVTILVDNAVKYATGDGVVQVKLAREGANVVFQTRNEWAHDVDPKQLDSLFGRFVRGDTSRDRSHGGNGYGLGLSIALAIAHRNHVKLAVQEDDTGRIVFRIVFASHARRVP